MNGKGGIALILSLGVLALLLVVGVSFVSYVRLQERALYNHLEHVKTGFAATAGVEHAFGLLKSQRSDGVDSFHSSWRTVFAGGDYDNSGDGFEDSRWIELDGPSGCLIARYAVLVEDESGKVNLNHSGNLSVKLAENLRAHGRNEGWTTYEISLLDFFGAMGFANPEYLAGLMVVARYGGHPDAGEYGFNLDINSDKIDNDGSGEVESQDPMCFTPWKPDPGLEHAPFVDLTHAGVFHGSIRSGMDLLKAGATVRSRTAAMYAENGIWHRRVNINAFDTPLTLYAALAGLPGISEGSACRYAVNILDYRDENIWISSFESPVTGDIFYGVESVMINEVLSNSYMEDTVPRTNNSGGEMGFVYSGLAPDTAYRISVGLGYGGHPSNIRFRVGSGAWQSGNPGADHSVIFREFDYFDIYNSISDSEGKITIYTDYEKNSPGEGLPAIGSVSIWNVHFVAAEFVELVNISDEEVLLEGWEIEVVSEESANIQHIPDSAIAPGDYFVLTNDIELFSISYPGAGNVLGMPGWESGYRSAGEFACDGDIAIYLYIDREMGLLADLSVDGSELSMPDISAPGQSSRVGASMEKRDPALRSFWFSNYFNRASPGYDNSMVPQRGLAVLSGIRDGTHPPLVKNKPLASPGEITKTGDWRGGDAVRYSGVRAGSVVWGYIPAYDLGLMAERISAGYCMRFDSQTAVIEGGEMRWSARLDRNSGAAGYDLFLYGEYTGSEEDVFIEGLGSFGFGESGGVYIGRLDSSSINTDGSFGFNISGEFDYALLVPDSVPGRININTAPAEVLRSLPFISPDAAESILDGRSGAPFESTGALLTGDILSPEEFAPVSNLISVNSDVFRIVCTARTPHPSDPSDPGLFISQRRVEVIVDRSGGRINPVSWKEIHD